MAAAQSGSMKSQLGAALDVQPIAPANRIASIDIVRGLALFGVMAINVVTEFRVSIFQQFLTARVDGTWFDRVLYSILMVGIDLKAFALFSLLFGVGLAIQHDHLSFTPRRTALLLRRLAFLMLVGAAHLVFIWNGDILFEYAIAGFVVLALLSGPSWLPIAAGAALLAVFVAAPYLPPVAAMPDSSWMSNNVSEAARIYSSGGFGEVLSFRIKELPGFLPLHLFIFPRTVALMLLGVVAWRHDVFRFGSTANRYLPWVAAVGIAVGGVMAASQGSHWHGWGWKAELSFDRLATILLACGYGAAIIVTSQTEGGRRLLAWAGPIGRMAFTNYLMQSLIFGWVFYGYGLGLFGKLGVTAALGIGVAVYILQVIFSICWLRQFRFGPVEWLWRTVMYGTWQPFAKA